MGNVCVRVGSYIFSDYGLIRNLWQRKGSKIFVCVCVYRPQGFFFYLLTVNFLHSFILYIKMGQLILYIKHSPAQTKQHIYLIENSIRRMKSRNADAALLQETALMLIY